MVTSLTFNQLQVRIFFLIFILFTSAVVSYRIFIERPQVERSLLQLAQKELQILSFSARNYLKSLNSINYDYAVWDQSYQYIKTHKRDYIEENFINDTFVSLKLDGVVIFKENLELVYAKGYEHQKGKPLKFSFYDFDSYPENKSIIPSRAKNQKVAQTSGLIKTKYGPALYSITEIKRSDRTGENRGFILFLKLFRTSVIDEIKKYTMTDITTQYVSQSHGNKALVDWTAEATLSAVALQRQRYILDVHKAPLVLLTMTHSEGEIPPLLDKESFSFISLFTLLIFVVYSLISHIIIRPVKQLAEQIKSVDERLDDTEKIKLLDENYHIKELDSVSAHFNELMATISRQKSLLNHQVYTDTLTNIANRRGFEQHLEKHCQLYIRQKVGFSVIIADIDHFKMYNDKLGHLAGDDALVKVAQLLDKHFKRSNDLCARYGGEEFIMFYSDISFEMLETKLAQILEAIAELNLPHPASETAAYVTVSLGACAVNLGDKVDRNITTKTVIRLADHALYQAKEEGRNRFVTTKYKGFTNN